MGRRSEVRHERTTESLCLHSVFPSLYVYGCRPGGGEAAGGGGGGGALPVPVPVRHMPCLSVCPLSFTGYPRKSVANPPYAPCCRTAIPLSSLPCGVPGNVLPSLMLLMNVQGPVWQVCGKAQGKHGCYHCCRGEVRLDYSPRCPSNLLADFRWPCGSAC